MALGPAQENKRGVGKRHYHYHLNHVATGPEHPLMDKGTKTETCLPKPETVVQPAVKIGETYNFVRTVSGLMEKRKMIMKKRQHQQHYEPSEEHNNDEDIEVLE